MKLGSFDVLSSESNAVNSLSLPANKTDQNRSEEYRTLGCSMLDRRLLVRKSNSAIEFFSMCSGIPAAGGGGLLTGASSSGFFASCINKLLGYLKSWKK